MLKIAFIWTYGYNPRAVMPLSVGYLKSNLDKASRDYDFRILDCALHNIRPENKALHEFLREFRPDVVGVTAWARESAYAIETLRLAKAIDPSVTTLVGGYHATCYADRIMEKNPEIDFLFRGEGEKALPRFLEEFQRTTPDYASVKGLVYRTSSGELVKNEIGYIDDLDSIAWPDCDAMDIESYFRIGFRNHSHHRRNFPLIATRGCPYRCSFCSAPLSIGKRVRKHSIEYLTEQIRYLYHQKDIRWFNFIDDNFTNDVEFAKELCRELINMDLKGVGYGTPSGVRMKKDCLELWQLMKRAGWKFIIVAPESASQRVLDKMKKDLKIEMVPDVIRDIKSSGLFVLGFFMVGYPGETRQDLEQTVSFIKKSGVDFVGMHNFQPIPGTPIYEELVSQGEIEDGTLPQKYGHGDRPYTPPELETVNFQLLFVRLYSFFLLRNPAVFLFMARGGNVIHLFRSLMENVLIGVGSQLRRLLHKTIPSQ